MLPRQINGHRGRRQPLLWFKGHNCGWTEKIAPLNKELHPHCVLIFHWETKRGEVGNLLFDVIHHKYLKCKMMLFYRREVTIQNSYDIFSCLHEYVPCHQWSKAEAQENVTKSLLFLILNKYKRINAKRFKAPGLEKSRTFS